jgi:hypothetical protein
VSARNVKKDDAAKQNWTRTAKFSRAGSGAHDAEQPMKLLEEIIDLAVGNKEPLSVLLRKCLVLASILKNTKLKEWVERELKGYGQDDPLPEYRVVPVVAKGNFSGIGGAKIENLPLPSGILDEKHREWATTTHLFSPIAAYEGLAEQPKDGGTPNIPWPADLVVHYQHKFIRGYVLVVAWQDIPRSAIISLIDTIRTRVLSFALEMQGEVERASDDPAAVPSEQVTRLLINNIYGGTVVVTETAHNISQSVNIVARGELDALISALRTVGLLESDIDGLKYAIREDEKSGVTEGVGPKSSSWLARTLGRVGKASLKVGADVARDTITRALLGYFGIG